MRLVGRPFGLSVEPPSAHSTDDVSDEAQHKEQCAQPDQRRISFRLDANEQYRETDEKA
jgi:hypothetical protein